MCQNHDDNGQVCTRCNYAYSANRLFVRQKVCKVSEVAVISVTQTNTIVRLDSAVLIQEVCHGIVGNISSLQGLIRHLAVLRKSLFL